MPKRVRCPHCDRLFDRDTLDSHILRCRSRTRATRVKDEKRRRVIVDGNNLAYHTTSGGSPSAKNLILAYRSLTSTGFIPIFVVSSALVHSIDRPIELEEFMLTAEVEQAPRGVDDDYRIIQLAKKRDADIISNDRFLNWIDRYPWLRSRLKKYRITPSGLLLV